MKKLTRILAFVFAFIMLATVPASAASAYQTYTYSISGQALYSPDAYTAKESYTSEHMGLEVPLASPGDLEIDDDGKVYIADTGNSRVVVLDPYYKLDFIIDTFINNHGIEDSFNEPAGLFVTDDTIWVCDTENGRIVTFDKQGNFKKVIGEPKGALVDETSIYKPIAVAVDAYGSLYVVGSQTVEGIIVMTDDGVFKGFFGAQAVTLSAWDILWRRFKTEEQLENSEQNISKPYNNITINEDGFVYVTIDGIDEESVVSSIYGKSTDGKYAPVKLINAAGDEIMRRNGFWPPSGEVDFATGKTDSVTGVSTIVDVAVGPEKTWSIIDAKRSKVYTYDFDGNLLFAFGDLADTSNVLGCIKYACAITYHGTDMVILDSGNNCVVRYERTPYGDLLASAIACQNNYEFDAAIEYWQQVIKYNQNFDAAYVGIGKALARIGEYEQSLEYFKKAYDTANYSSSYTEVRAEWMSKFFILFLIIIAVLIFAVSKFLGLVGKINKKATLKKTKRTFIDELCYGFYVMVHPFDGFWDLKHEKRGSLRASFTYIVLTIIAFFYQSIGQGYIANPQGYYSSIFVQMISVLIPLILFVLANWCLTTLFEGEGSFKDIFIAVSYSLLPIPLIIIPCTIASNFLISTELAIVNIFITFAFIWLGALVFCGTMVTHDYSLGKNFITFLGTIVAMAFIMFIVILFSTLVGKLVGLIAYDKTVPYPR